MRSGERPNILWYCTDSQRYDTVGKLGNKHIRTPTLDGLISGGAAFTRAYAQSTMCTPSRVSFMTGRYCASHHVYRNGNAGLPPTETMVTKLLQTAGYDCALVGKLHMSSSKFGEKRPDDGYRVFYWSNLPNPDGADHLNAYHHWLKNELGVDPRQLYNGPRPFVGAGMPAEFTQTRWVTEMAKRFICEKRDGPWLISINPFSPHPPYDPPKEYLDRHDPSHMPPPLFRPSDLERQKAFMGIRHQNIYARNPLQEDEGRIPADESASAEYFAAQTYKPPVSFNGRLMKCGYYAQIEVIDHYLGELVDCLRATGQLNNTIIVYHSDHGELLGDHGLVFKGARFFEGSVHVPMIWNWPDTITSNFQSDALVELVDIAPTLLEAAGLEVPYYVQGKSLLPMMTGTATEVHKTHAVCDFYDSVGYSQVDDPTQATMSFDGRYKMVIYHRHCLGELFDLQDDPGEYDNLWSRPECRDLKLEIMLRHIDAVMFTISPGPPRVTQY